MIHTKNTMKSNHNHTTTYKNKKFLGPASSHGGPRTIHTYIYIDVMPLMGLHEFC